MKNKDWIPILGVTSILIGAVCYDFETVVKLFTVWEGWLNFVARVVYVAAFIPIQVAALIYINKKEKKTK